MAVSKAVAEARERLRTTEAKHHDLREQIKENAIARKPIEAKRARILAAAQRHPIVILRPGDRVTRTTFAAYGLGYGMEYNGAKEILAAGPRKMRAAAYELVMSGATKLNLAGEGTSLTARGVAAKSRTPHPDAIRAMVAADRKVKAAEDALRKAKNLQAAAYKAALESGDKVVPEQVADYLADLIEVTLKLTALRDPYTGEADREVADAKRHLAHAEKGTGPCPCVACSEAERRKRWAAESAKRAKETAAREKAEARALEKLPRVSFTCPRCGRDSVAVVADGKVRCASTVWPVCGPFAIESLRTKKVPKTTPIGLIAAPEGAAA